MRHRMVHDMTVAVWIVGTLAVLAALKTWRRERVYHCRAKGCGRTFIDPLERSHHFRRAHLS